MIPKIWHLSENSGDDNLGLACTEQGLVLGRTLLIERRDGRFVVRERSELEHLFSLAYGRAVTAQRLMPGLTTVASALNANDQALARIAAVQLRIPDLPDRAARDAMEALDVLIKSADWNATLHPRTGVPPNPGWFAPTDGDGDGAYPTRTAQNDDPAHRSDVAPSAGDDGPRLPPENAQENSLPLTPVADNQRENKTFRDVVVRLGLNQDQAQRLHREISGMGYNYHEILQIAQDMFGK
jgi:hypothetical protein